MPLGVTNSSEVWIDAFKMVVTYQHFDPGYREEDRFYFYNLDHNLIASMRNGYTQTLTYDDKSNITSRETEGETWHYGYHPIWNKTTNIIDPKESITRMEYDARGNLIRTTAYDLYGNGSR